MVMSCSNPLETVHSRHDLIDPAKEVDVLFEVCYSVNRIWTRGCHQENDRQPPPFVQSPYRSRPVSTVPHAAESPATTRSSDSYIIRYDGLSKSCEFAFITSSFPIRSVSSPRGSFLIQNSWAILLSMRAQSNRRPPTSASASFTPLAGYSGVIEFVTMECLSHRLFKVHGISGLILEGHVVHLRCIIPPIQAVGQYKSFRNSFNNKHLRTNFRTP